MIKQGVILASGLGSRLNSEGRNEPKPLMPVCGMALIERVIMLMKSAGIEQIVIVLGYRSEQMINFLNQKKFTGISTVINDEYNKKNGISLLKSKGNLSNEPFLLSMADHIFSDNFFNEFLAKAEPELENSDVLLSIDRDIEGVFDLNDATKVFTEENIIVKIGKDLGAYNAVDTGLFLCNHKIFEKLESIYSKTGDVSISEGMKALADEKRFCAIDMTGQLWQDVDTPSMKTEAEQRLIDNFVKSDPHNNFFSNRFFLKISKEIALHLFKNENFDWRVVDSLFFAVSTLISVISIKLGIVFPSLVTVFLAILIHYLNQLKNSVKPTGNKAGFSLFSFESNFIVSTLPVVIGGTNIFAGVTILILMIAAITSRLTGTYNILKNQIPELPDNLSKTYLSPSFFIIVFSLLVILNIPCIVISTILLIFVLFYELNKEDSK